MIRGLYTSASGMLAEMRRNDIIANNLANVNTTAFKEDFVAFKTLREMRIHRVDDSDNFKGIGSHPLIGSLGLGSELQGTYTNYSQGSLRKTGNQFDIAIEGPGFLAVETQDGIRYTRNGSLKLDTQGYLVTKEGYRVLGEQGPIRLQGNVLKISEDGQVLEDGELLDTIAVVDFQDRNLLVKQGESFFVYNGEMEDVFVTDSKVRQGFLETSNVNPVKAMVKMIDAVRAYEANQRVIKTHDNLLGKAVNDVARI